MEEKKHDSVFLQAPQENPLLHLQERFKKLDLQFKSWLSNQSLPVEAAVVTLTGAVQGGAMGAFMGSLTGDVLSLKSKLQSGASPQAIESLKQAQAISGSPLAHARNFAVMTGVNAGILCILKRVRGVEDIQNSMAAAFGSGAMFSLVSGTGGPNPAGAALGSGLFFALIQGGLYQLGQQFSPQTAQQPMEDLTYARTKNMLKNLGLENYMGNFKKGMLTDQTLSLLTDSALSEVHIPPGPRLLILNHIQRDSESMKATRPS